MTNQDRIRKEIINLLETQQYENDEMFFSIVKLLRLYKSKGLLKNEAKLIIQNMIPDDSDCSDPKIDTLVAVLHVIINWCHPSQYIWNDEK